MKRLCASDEACGLVSPAFLTFILTFIQIIIGLIYLIFIGSFSF